MGNYTNGIKTGTWTCYKAKDTIERQYNYSSQKLEFYTGDTSKKAFVISGTDTTETKVDCPPFRLIGNKTWMDVLSHYFSYPDEARKNNQEGKVLIAFTVFSDGHTSPPCVKKSVAPSLDAEALRVANMIPFDCIPAILNGKPVTSIFIQPVSFKLE